MKQEAERGSVGTNLTEGNILRQLILFVIPLLLTNFVQQLYNTVDIMVIGRFVGNHGTVGVSTGGEVVTLLTFIATSFGSAGQIYVAQLYGAGKRKDISEMIGTTLTFMTLTSIVIAGACITFCNTILGWLNCPKEAFLQARNYMTIVSLGMPFVFGYNAVCGILRGLGESKRPLLFVSVAAVSNIVMDILFVAIIPLEAAGTAIATIAAQFASFAAAAIFLYRKKDQLGLEFSVRGFGIRKEHFIVLLKLGLPLTASSTFIHFSQLICSAQINNFGLVASATNSIGNNVHKMINIFTSSINAGSGAMAGQNLGARKFERVKKIVYTTMGCSMVFAVVGCSIVLFFPKQVYALFTTDAEVIEFGVTFLRICMIALLISPVQGSFNAVVTASGNVWLGFLNGLLDGMVLRLGIGFFLAYACDLGVEGFFYGNSLARLAPVLLSGSYFYSGKWKTRSLVKQQ